MAIPVGVWGIDIGQCALKAVRLQEVDGTLQATAFDYVEHPKILSQPDADPDQLTHEALKKFLSRNTLRGDIVVISVPGQSGLARFVKLPPVEEKKISDIVRFEAKQQIPFNLDEVVWDYQKIGQGTVTDGFAMETEIGLFAMKRDMVHRYLQHFKDVNVEVHIVQMAPLALCNFVAYDLLGKGDEAPKSPEEQEEEAAQDKRNCIVALDIGADSSNLIITDGDKIIWQRPIPLGGNHFTRALTKDLKLTFAKAEHLKRNATKSPDLKKILASLKPVLNDFVSEVQRSLAFFTNTHRDAQIEYMIGLGNAFRLPGLQRFLAEKLQLDVRKLGKMERMTGDAVVTQQAYTENVLSFAVAYGLALQGMKRSRLITNLLPGEIRIERLIRAKKPYAVAASAALLLGASAYLLSYYLDDRPFADKRVTDAITVSKDAVKQAQEAKAKFEDTKKKALAEEEAVKSIVAGQMERANWLQLLKYIDDAVPRPDGSNLTLEMKEQYWFKPPDEKLRKDVKTGMAMTGEQAWKEYQKRLKGGPATAKDSLGDELGAGINDLIQFNIEAIDCRYCDDLPGFWKNAKEFANNQWRWRPKSHFDKPPEAGKAWIVELRGYTFHYGERIFIANTLLENLARFGLPSDETRNGPQAVVTLTMRSPLGQAACGVVGAATNAAKALAEAPTAAAGKAADGPVHNVYNRVSSIVLVTSIPSQTSSSTGLSVSSQLSGLVKSAPASGGAAAGAGGAAGMNAQNMNVNMPQGGAAAAASSGGGRDSWGTLLTQNLGGGGRSNASTTTGNEPQGPHTRTDFSVVFIWREATPSDALRGMEGGPAPRR
jgi:type IV pilus assembly protein PilM